jgi:hypothetical protein
MLPMGKYACSLAGVALAGKLQSMPCAYIGQGCKDGCLDEGVHLWRRQVGGLVGKVGPGTKTLQSRNTQQQQHPSAHILV